MLPSILPTLLLAAGLVSAQVEIPVDPKLVGTWASKSNSTLTGPGFYDPVNDQFTEPKHTGISYSFTADGFYEESYYRAIANPANPKCPKGIIQWQHGSFKAYDNGSLVLTPIAVDGRQLLSDPCLYKNAVYTRYNTTELIKKYERLTDGYTTKERLNLYKWDGAPQMPLYLAMSPPEMLPTTTLNPIVSGTATAGAQATGSKQKRSFPGVDTGVLGKRTPAMKSADNWWWFGVFLTASGGVLYFFF